MFDVKKFYAEMGVGVSIVVKGKVESCYLLSDEEKAVIEEIAKILEILPEDIQSGVLQFEKKLNFGFLKVEDFFVAFPARTENFIDLIRRGKDVAAGCKIIHSEKRG